MLLSFFTFFAYEFSEGPSEVYPRPVPDPLENLFGRRSLDLAFEDVLDEIGEGLTPSLRALHELTMQPVWDVADLDHLRHAFSMSHVHHMCNGWIDP